VKIVVEMDSNDFIASLMEQAPVMAVDHEIRPETYFKSANKLYLEADLLFHKNEVLFKQTTSNEQVRMNIICYSL
jgi:hypothetical protein